MPTEEQLREFHSLADTLTRLRLERARAADLASVAWDEVEKAQPDEEPMAAQRYIDATAKWTAAIRAVAPIEIAFQRAKRVVGEV